nr:PREDICTED: premnaspirodiene oxygenase-like [Musa acuminata subsp. malaccensis]
MTQRGHLWFSMELLQLPSIPVLVFSFLFLLLLIKKRGFTGCRNESHPPRRPPGPWNLPFVGCMHHLVGQLPFRAFRELARKHGPLMLLRLGQVDVVVVSSREAAEEILKNQSVTFASRPELLSTKFVFYGPTGIVWAPYGPYWRQLLKLCCMELFSAGRIRSFSPIRTEETLDLMRDIARSGGTTVNLTEKLFGLSNAIVCRAAFGKRRKHRERFIPVIKDALALSSGFRVADMFPSLKFIDILSGAVFRLRRLRRQLDEILEDIIKEHEGKASASSGDKAGEVDDLVDVLLRLKDDPQLEVPLTMENVKGVIVDMFLGGTETSSTVVEWAMSELMRNPEIMERAQKEVRELAAQRRNRVEESDISELNYMKLIIKETLRLHPPAPLLPRLCRETCEVMGYRIDAGTRVFVNLWANGRDARYWDDAETFKPERFEGSAMDFKGVDFEYLPFGAGPRICPGMGFGMATVELALTHLLLHFDWELPHGMRPEELDMSETMGLATPRKTELMLIATVPVPLPVAT